MNYEIIYNGETGKTYSVMPIASSLSLSDWSTLRVAMTEAGSPNTGKYAGTVDTDVSAAWALFESATQPASWATTLYEFDLTDELTSDAVANQSDISVADVETALANYGTSTATEVSDVGLKVDALNDPALSDIRQEVDESISDYNPSTTPELNEAESDIRGSDLEDLTKLAGDIATIDTKGSGSNAVTITINDGSDPIDGVAVWVTTSSDSSASNVIAGTRYTNSLGKVDFLIDDGTYYVWKQLSGWEFDNPGTLVVA